MPNVQYSSFDRGYDPGHSDVTPTKAPTIERGLAAKGPSNKPLKMIIAVAMVLIMVASAFVMIAPTLKSNHDKSTQTAPDSPAKITIGGTHYVNTTISNMFESYQKVSTANGGSHGSTPGLNDWWVARFVTYADVVVRSAYPYVIGYGPYSAEVPAAGVAIPTMKYGLYSFYRTTIDSPSLTTISTGANMPLGFVPVLGTPWTTYNAMSGGWVNWSYYITYCTVADIAAAEAGTGYMLSYYGATPAQFNFGGANGNDGWYIDFQGKVDFNRAAAKKFLGLTGSADLRTQFNDNNTGANLGKMNASWANFWIRDGSPTGSNDTYAAYDFSLDLYPFLMFLSVDPTSTASKLVLRVYSIGWGLEILMLRYLDKCGVSTKSVNSPEDWYLNGTASPNGADIKSRMVSVYNMMAWKDKGFFSPAWLLDVMHSDYTPNNAAHPWTPTNGKWLSRYNPYMATKTYKPTYMTWSPGTTAYGTGTAYWFPPMNWNLLANEKIVIKLPTESRSTAGYTPYVNTLPQDTLTAAKLVELNNHIMWGEIGLGNCTPNSLRSATYYNHATKTLTLTGPMTFARNPNSAFPLLNATGSPSFSFDVMRVSNYVLTPGSLLPGTSTLRVTAYNNTGWIVTNWNGTVNLTTASAGINFGGKSWVLVKFSAAGGGNATTSMTVTTAGSKTITSTDWNNSLDIINTTTFTVIGEFPTLLIPVIGIIAAVVITVGRRDKKKDEQ